MNPKLLFEYVVHYLSDFEHSVEFWMIMFNAIFTYVILVSQPKSYCSKFIYVHLVEIFLRCSNSRRIGISQKHTFAAGNTSNEFSLIFTALSKSVTKYMAFHRKKHIFVSYHFSDRPCIFQNNFRMQSWKDNIHEILEEIKNESDEQLLLMSNIEVVLQFIQSNVSLYMTIEKNHFSIFEIISKPS